MRPRIGRDAQQRDVWARDAALRADGRMLAVDALPSSSCHTTGRIFAERDWRKHQIGGVCGVSVLARLFDSGHHRQVDQWPGITASSTRTVLIEAVTRHSVDGTQCGSGWYGPRSSLKRQIARFLNVQKDTQT